jgi:hypothetical protein
MIFFENLSQIRPKTLKIDLTAITLFNRLCSGEGKLCAAIQYTEVKGKSNESLLESEPA